MMQIFETSFAVSWYTGSSWLSFQERLEFRVRVQMPPALFRSLGDRKAEDNRACDRFTLTSLSLMGWRR